MRNRRSYGGLMQQPVWGAFEGDKLNGTVRAASRTDAHRVFRRHNERWPEFAIHGLIRMIR